MRRISTLFCQSRSCGGSPQYLPPSGRFCQSRSCGGSPHFLPIPVMRRISTLFANPGHAEDLHSTCPLLADFANPGHAEDLHSTCPLLAEFANLGHAEDFHTLKSSTPFANR